jgi:2-oxoglutarate ferredoxin oxidoreductase subunit beta
VVSGIGCSSRIPAYTNCYGFHGVHGRALAAGTGLKVARPDLTVLVAGGDGDGYSIGGNHFLHACRRNVDLTYIVMDNQIYGLTTGQTSPTSVKGMKTKSTPLGNLENPINPIPLAMVAGATYVARGYTGQIKHLVGLIKGGIMHKGFSLIDVFSPCVTFNHENTHDFFKQRTYKLEDQGHDPKDFHAAMEQGYRWGEEIPIGLFWQRDDLPRLDQLEPVLAEGGALARRPLGVLPEQAQKLVRELM